jgi:hypothetical protein
MLEGGKGGGGAAVRISVDYTTLPRGYKPNLYYCMTFPEYDMRTNVV